MSGLSFPSIRAGTQAPSSSSSSRSYFAAAAALVAPALFGLVGSEVGARKPAFADAAGPSPPSGIVALWGLRIVERKKAIELGSRVRPGQRRRSSASQPIPYPINPFHWQTIVETPPALPALRSSNTLQRQVTSSPQPTSSTSRPPHWPPRGQASWLGQVYLDWSQIPWSNEAPRSTDPTVSNNRHLPRPALYLRCRIPRTPKRPSWVPSYQQRPGSSTWRWTTAFRNTTDALLNIRVSLNRRLTRRQERRESIVRQLSLCLH